jgi:benzoyl-CoA reductase/2-hydroxyglutaryl-CoA dehydratase subunit BcrC/BadD/HgdB
MDTKAGVDSIQTQIDGMDGALKQLEASASGTGDAKAIYNDFVAKLDKLESTRSDTRSRAERMESIGDEYFRKWEEELGTLKNESIRKVSMQRRTELNEAYQKIKESMKNAGKEFTPYVNDLRDLKSYFSTDLTAAGIKAMDANMKRTVKEGSGLKETGVRLSKDLQKVIDLFKTPEMTPPAQGTAK